MFKDKGVELALLILSIIVIVFAFFPSVTTNIDGSLPDRLIIFIYKIALVLMPYAIAFFTGYIAWKMWVHYIRQDFISGIEWIVLEVIPPREVERSPEAMELFFTNALYHWSNKGGREEYWQGAVWFWFSLELVSTEGQVHFYLRIPSRLKELVETQMYAQYPQAQVKVVDDYTLEVDELSPRSNWKGWGCEFRLKKPEAFPLKTYEDYGLADNPDEELKIDPITPIIEFFGSLKKGEHAWIQIVVTPTKKTWKVEGKWFETRDWVAESEHQIKLLLEPYTRHHKDELAPGGHALEPRVPSFLDEIIEIMRHKTTKLGFETGIRVMYVAKKEAFNISNRRNIRLIFRQFDNPNSNGLDRFNSTQGDALGSSIFPLSPPQVEVLSERMLHEYRERAFYHLPMRHHLFSTHNPLLSTHWLNAPFMMLVKMFFLPYFHHATYVLNVEELATLWHFPGQILKTPTLERIESKEASPPPNLPV